MLHPFTQTQRKFANLLATGQATSYGSGTGVDDGALQLGIAKPTSAYLILTTGQYSGTTNITINGKTDAHSNACVVDLNTRKMWSRTASASVGPASDGKLPWTTTGSGATAEGIFPYCAAANTAALAGYSDWRVPNFFELFGLADSEAPTGYPNSTAFPTLTVAVWSSTTRPDSTTSAMRMGFINIAAIGDTKTVASSYYCILVRG